MASNTVKDLMCENCGAEYTITYDNDQLISEIVCCPFCGFELDSYTDDAQQEWVMK